MKTRIPPDIEGDGKNQDQAGNKDNFEEERALS
jgi:hypothetical protein